MSNRRSNLSNSGSYKIPLAKWSISMGEQKPIQVELTEEELAELLRDLPPYKPELRSSDIHKAVRLSSLLGVN